MLKRIKKKILGYIFGAAWILTIVAFVALMTCDGCTCCICGGG